MSKPAQVVILGEDRAHIGAVYNAVTRHLGVAAGRVRKLPTSDGQGDATKYVLDRVATEARALRRGPTSARLVVCIDADTKTAKDRCSDLDSRLKSAGCDDDRSRESIAYVVPQRNIETWQHFASCEAVDENTNYKSGRRSQWKSEDLRRVGALLAKDPIPKENPPGSLSTARSELRRRILQQ